MRSLKATGSLRMRSASSSGAVTRVPHETQPSVCTSSSCIESRGFSTHWEPGIRMTSLPLSCKRRATSFLGTGITEITAWRAASLKTSVRVLPTRMSKSTIITRGKRRRFFFFTGGRLIAGCEKGRSVL